MSLRHLGRRGGAGGSGSFTDMFIERPVVAAVVAFIASRPEEKAKP